MNLNAALNLLLEEYSSATTQPFAGNSMAEFVRREVPNAVKQIIGDDDRYLIHGSSGQGNWARVPWVAIYNRFITETAQDGYYVVYLVKEDFSGIYLSLNQGVTTIRQMYGSDAKDALTARSSDYIARLGKIDNSLVIGTINLEVSSASSLGAYYEQGSICAKYYKRGEIPNDEILRKDLKELLRIYLLLAKKDLTPNSVSTEEEDESSLNTEDLTNLREHKRIERNRKLAEKAKKIHGYVCQACGFDFAKVYGDIGQEFIEAHHLTPLHTLRGQRVTLDPKKDFSVLCANCHRMIHRSDFVNDIEGFRSKHVERR
jgi:5-methylcytosine-specific restriction protein A